MARIGTRHADLDGRPPCAFEMAKANVLMGLGAALMLSVLTVSEAKGANLPPGFTDTLVLSHLESPTVMEIAPDGRLFVAEKRGRVRVIVDGILQPQPFLTLPVSDLNERGLVGLTLDPDFETNHFVYVYYTATYPIVHNRLSRFTEDGNVAAPGSELVLLDLDRLRSTHHNGGSLHFGADGMLYIGVGDNQRASSAQSLGSLFGKILRLSPDGSIPADNPSGFSGLLGVATGRNRAIWAVGLRNPFTTAIHPSSGKIFINDVGETKWEEVDRGVAGANYGWPKCEGSCSPSDEDLRDPLYTYRHAPDSNCAITGGTFYAPRLRQFPAHYVNSYFFADLCGGWIRNLESQGRCAREFLTNQQPGIVDLDVGSDGSLYYLSFLGEIHKVEYTGGLQESVVEENSPTIRFDGWEGIDEASASGGSYRSSRVAGDRAAFAFSGASITWLSRRGPDQGIAQVTIDGKPACRCDLYAESSETGYQRRFSGLQPGRHEIEIRVRGLHAPSSTGSSVTIDGFIVGNEITQETDPDVRFNAWSNTVRCQASGSAVSSSSDPDAVASLDFLGTGIDWITTRGPSYGRAQVLIDDIDRGVVDLYAPRTEWAAVESYSGLTEGLHRIQVRVLGERNRASQGSKVVIDAFRIGVSPVDQR